MTKFLYLLNPLAVLVFFTTAPTALLADDPCLAELAALEKCSEANTNLAPMDYCFSDPLVPEENVTCATFASGVCSWQSRTIQCEPCRDSVMALLFCYTAASTPDELYSLSFEYADASAKDDCPTEFPCSGTLLQKRLQPALLVAGVAIGLWAGEW